MANYPCEMLGHFFYSSSLTYEQLHELEKNLWKNADQLLITEGAVHINFIQGEDCLQIECEFNHHDRKLFDALAEQFSTLLVAATALRLIFINKASMSNIHIYDIVPNNFKLQEISMPLILNDN